MVNWLHSKLEQQQSVECNFMATSAPASFQSFMGTNGVQKLILDQRNSQNKKNCQISDFSSILSQNQLGISRSRVSLYLMPSSSIASACASQASASVRVRAERSANRRKIANCTSTHLSIVRNVSIRLFKCNMHLVKILHFYENRSAMHNLLIKLKSIANALCL